MSSVRPPATRAETGVGCHGDGAGVGCHGDGATANMIAKKIDSRTTITEPGVYRLARDIERGGGTFISETCIRIESDGVVLDGAGHRIDGRGVSDTTGVAVAASTPIENVTVTNVTVTDWDRGLFFDDVTRAVLHDVRVVGNGYGVSFESARDVVVSSSRVTDNLLGVSVDPSSDVRLWNNAIESNHARDVFRQSGPPAE